MAKNTTYAEQSKFDTVKQQAHAAISDMKFAKIDDETVDTLSGELTINASTIKEEKKKSYNNTVSQPTHAVDRTEEKHIDAKTEKKQGRPFLYQKELKRITVSFSFPEDIIKQMKRASALRGTNATQYILNLIKKDWDENGNYYSQFPDIK